MQPAESVIIFGGAGFVGSNIARVFVENGVRVTVVDGLLDRTGGTLENLSPIKDRISIVRSRIEETKDLVPLVCGHDYVIDAMAWTSHRASLDDPLYDLRLNAESHLHLIIALRERTDARVILLGSRGQYGKPNAREIIEDTAMNPRDIQGIHKVAAESYFRVYAALYGMQVSSIRFSNCYGPNQTTGVGDIGLVGSFIRDALAGRTIEVFGDHRRRSINYVNDVAEIVFRIANAEISGFQGFNLRGFSIGIEDLANTIVRLAGSGTVRRRDLPVDIGAIDIGDAPMIDDNLRKLLGGIPESDVESSLKRTIEYFKRRAS